MSAFSLPTLGENIYIKVTSVPGTLTTALSPTSGNFIDVSGYEWFAFLLSLGSTNNNVDMHIEQATTTSGSPKDITGAVITQLTSGDGSKWAMVQVRTDKLDGAGGYKYVTANLTIAGTTVGTVMFLGWRGDTVPVTQPAANAELVVLA